MAAGGYDIKLINPLPKQLQCPYCLKLMREPIQTVHGERACKLCYDMLSESITHESSKSTFLDKHAAREIRQLPCMCKNEPDCPWKGVVSQHDEHLQICEYNLVSCRLCGENIKKMNLSQHDNQECSGRNVKCRYCQLELMASSQEDHEISCNMRYVDCPYNCGKKIALNDTDKHTEECIVLKKGKVCPYAIMGCKYQVSSSSKRSSSEKMMEKHLLENIKEHAGMATSEVCNLKQAVKTSTEDLIEKKKKCVSLNEEVKNLKSALNSANSNLADLHHKLKMHQEHIGELMQRKDQKSTVDDVQNRIQKLQKKLEKVSMEVANVPSYEKDDLGSFKNFEKVLKSKETQINELLDENAKVSSALSDVNLKVQLLEQAVYDGKQLWRLDNVKQRMNEARAGKYTAIHSPPGFSKRGGYKFCCRLYLNGDGMGKGTHVSLFFVIMKSEYDNLNKWPFTSRVTFKLINPKNDRDSHTESFIPDRLSSSFQKPTKDMNIAAGCPMFITLDRLQNQNFIMDDCLFFETIIAPS